MRNLQVGEALSAAAQFSKGGHELSTFEFVTVLIAIVIGLGITRILSGFSALLEHRLEIKPDWLTIIWAVNVLGYQLIYWWIVVNNWRFLSEWSFSRFGLLFLYSVLLFFCASLILPSQLESGMDMKARFETIRKPFYILWLLVICSDLADSFLKGSDYVLAELGWAYAGLMSYALLLPVLGLFISDRRFHFAAAISFFIVYASWTLSSFATI